MDIGIMSIIIEQGRGKDLAFIAISLRNREGFVNRKKKPHKLRGFLD
jgi:hypothetical protein